MKKLITFLMVLGVMGFSSQLMANKCKQACEKAAKSCSKGASLCKQAEQKCKNLCR